LVREIVNIISRIAITKSQPKGKGMKEDNKDGDEGKRKGRRVMRVLYILSKILKFPSFLDQGLCFSKFNFPFTYR